MAVDQKRSERLCKRRIIELAVDDFEVHLRRLLRQILEDQPYWRGTLGPVLEGRGFDDDMGIPQP